jgi:hypothetical protein
MNVQVLVDDGYDLRDVLEALALTGDRLGSARDYLISGALLCDTPLTEIGYRECPLFYLVLEIADCFFRLWDHCSVCGQELGVAGVKPSLCDKEVCFFAAARIGVNSPVVSELRRDPFVADFLVCLASAAFGTKFFVPPFPRELGMHGSAFFATLPAMEALTRCANDRDLREEIGPERYKILRFILAANRAHLVHLPERLKLTECADGTEQLLCVAAPPEKELLFRKKKGTAQSAWLWHGSTATRWHSILHNGLQDLGNTSDRTHMGADTFGPGVYQSHNSSTSIAYCASPERADAINTHRYLKSTLPQNLKCWHSSRTSRAAPSTR